jgi:hypothetical protein
MSLDYEELLRKINELDLENSRLRDLLKSSSYHKITKVEINTTKQSKNKSLLNDVTNTSFTEDKFSFSEVKTHVYKSSEKKDQDHQKEQCLEPIRIQLEDVYHCIFRICSLMICLLMNCNYVIAIMRKFQSYKGKIVFPAAVIFL